MRPSASHQKIRVVIAKPGLDGHDRGVKIIARALRDAGMEVIYTGLHQTPEQIVETVIQEDADVVGLSILSGAHMTLIPRIVELLREQGASEVPIVVGGTIPADDILALKALGVAEVFTPGATANAAVEFIRTAAYRSHTAADAAVQLEAWSLSHSPGFLQDIDQTEREIAAGTMTSLEDALVELGFSEQDIPVG